MRRALIAAIVAVVVLSAATMALTPPDRPTALTVRPDPAHVLVLSAALRRMTSNAANLTRSPGPADIIDYDVGAEWMRGVDGTGTTIALVEGWNDPTIDATMAGFDQEFGLPAPDIRTIYPTGNGHLPARCPPGMAALGDYGSCDAWGGELTLDVETAHLVAPYATILLVVTPADSEMTDDAASQVAPPEMMAGVEYVSEHHLADVVSISDGTGEQTYTHGRTEITAQDPGELAAAAAGIPVVVATGDCGAVQNLAVATSQCGDTTTTPDTAVWDDSPWVTAVGGSVPELSATGTRQGPDQVWQQEGAGFSAVYARPDYQRAVAVGNMRSVPDIVMDARSGTSESAPMFAGVLALAAQLHQGPLGPINDALYEVLGPAGTRDGITDVDTGNDSVPAAAGYSAHPGFDVATGWGTVDAATFIPALVTAVRAERGAPIQQAAAALAQLRQNAHLSTTDVAAGHSATLSAGGFLPTHPVTLNVDGHPITTLTATPTGTVSTTLDPTALRLAPGQHTLTLHSMLLNEQIEFHSM